MATARDVRGRHLERCPLCLVVRRGRRTEGGPHTRSLLTFSSGAYERALAKVTVGMAVMPLHCTLA